MTSSLRFFTLSIIVLENGDFITGFREILTHTSGGSNLLCIRTICLPLYKQIVLIPQGVATFCVLELFVYKEVIVILKATPQVHEGMVFLDLGLFCKEKEWML